MMIFKETKKRKMTAGVPLEGQFSQERMKEIITECNGIIRTIATKCSCKSRQPIYDYLDVYPALEEHRQAVLHRFDNEKVETGYDVLEQLIENIDKDPAHAMKAAKLILENSKKSLFKRDKKDDLASKDEAAALKDWGDYLEAKRRQESALSATENSESIDSKS